MTFVLNTKIIWDRMERKRLRAESFMEQKRRRRREASEREQWKR